MDATQCAKILAYCNEHGSITAREAFIRLNINSPRKAISDLKRQGYVVDVVKCDNKGRTPYNRYYIKKRDDE